jgi:hypothetical protein
VRWDHQAVLVLAAVAVVKLRGLFKGRGILAKRAVLGGLAVLASAAVLGNFCNAAEITLKHTGDGDIIIIRGEIEYGDGEVFRSRVANESRAVIGLDSEGGNVHAAIMIGTEIRMRAFATAVLPGLKCASACALIWLAGIPRGLTYSEHGGVGMVGFHAAQDVVTGEQSAANAVVGSYLGKLGLSDHAIRYLTDTPPDEIRWLMPDVAQRLGIALKVVKVDDGTHDVPVSPAVTPRKLQSLDKGPRKKNETSPAGGAVAPMTGPKPRTTLSQSELDALRARLHQCWNAPAGAAEADKRRVLLIIRFNQDGTLSSPPQPETAPGDSFTQAMMDSAVRATLRCQPYTMLSPAKYDLWKEIEVDFSLDDPPAHPPALRTGRAATEQPVRKLPQLEPGLDRGIEMPSDFDHRWSGE